ncbi:MAG: hypothetical protein HC918_09955 [Oscillatoriales cyanobacterium SM2_1_8]|nr:hypothetical protein [Oscillatoriales cyanobacterium SM2_1_8]
MDGDRALGIGAVLGAIARWLWPPRPVRSPDPVATRPRAAPPPANEDEADWLDDLDAEPRDSPRRPNTQTPPPVVEEEEEDEDEDDEDTYLIARYIRR